MRIGTEADGTPIFFGLPGDTLQEILAYREAKNTADSQSTEHISAFLEGYDQSRRERHIIFRTIANFMDYLLPDLTILAYRNALRGL